MLIILLFVFFLLFTKILIKDKLSLVFLQLYLIWWALLLFISTFNPYGLFPVSEYIYGILILSIFCFSLGFISNKNIRNVNNNERKLLNEDLLLKYLIELSKSKIFLFLLIFFSIFIYRYLLRYQAVILLHGSEEARTLRFYVGEVFSSSAEIYFYNYFVETFSILVTIYLAFSIVLMQFKTTFFISVFFLYLYSSFGAGRGIIIELGFYIIFLFIIKGVILNRSLITSDKLRKLKSRKIKSLFIILPLLFGLYIFSIYLSNYRLGLNEMSLENFKTGNDEFLSQIIIYCVGSFRALEYGIVNFSSDIGYTYGGLTFGAIDEVISLFLGFLGFDVQPSNFEYGLKTSSFITIGYNQTFNALFTNVFVQYLDFGILGVVLFSFFWGVISNKSIQIFHRTQSVFSLALVSFLFVISIFSALSWKLQSVSSFMFLIILYLMRKK
jgi:oligosaccharide repeat unit polymerase